MLGKGPTTATIAYGEVSDRPHIAARDGNDPIQIVPVRTKIWAGDDLPGFDANNWSRFYASRSQKHKGNQGCQYGQKRNHLCVLYHFSFKPNLYIGSGGQLYIYYQDTRVSK